MNWINEIHALLNLYWVLVTIDMTNKSAYLLFTDTYLLSKLFYV